MNLQAKLAKIIFVYCGVRILWKLLYRFEPNFVQR